MANIAAVDAACASNPYGLNPDIYRASTFGISHRARYAMSKTTSFAGSIKSLIQSKRIYENLQNTTPIPPEVKEAFVHLPPAKPFKKMPKTLHLQVPAAYANRILGLQLRRDARSYNALCGAILRDALDTLAAFNIDHVASSPDIKIERSTKMRPFFALKLKGKYINIKSCEMGPENIFKTLTCNGTIHHNDGLLRLLDWWWYMFENGTMALTTSIGAFKYANRRATAVIYSGTTTKYTGDV
jgi:hypothetical protein